MVMVYNILIDLSFRKAKLAKLYPCASSAVIDAMVKGVVPSIERMFKVSLADLNAYADLVSPIDPATGVRMSDIALLRDSSTRQEIRDAIDKHLTQHPSLSASDGLSDDDLLALLPSRYADDTNASVFADYAREYISQLSKKESLEAQAAAKSSDNANK